MAPSLATPIGKEVSASELDHSHLEDKQHGGLHEEVLPAAHEVVVVDETLVKGMVRKFDLHLLILFAIINIFNFIDRSNVGNARILGMAKDLKLVGNKYAIAVMCTTFPIFATEIPFNIVCKKIGARIWIPSMVFICGLITCLLSLTQTAGGLYAVRFMLGFPEGGISPAIIWLLSQFYRRSEMGLRVSIYISATGSSGAFGGLLAIGLSKIPKWGMIKTWRNIFFFEGLISMGIGIVAWFIIPNGPQTAKFLTEEEKTIAINRLRVDAAGTDEHGTTKFKHVLQAMTSPHVIGCGLGFCMGNIAQNALSIYIPTIINGFGYGPTTSQWLSVGPYGVAAILGISLGWLSDRYNTRSLIIMGCTPLAAAGFFMLEFLSVHHTWAKYGALYLVLPPLFASLPIWMAWCLNNCATATVRASAAGTLFTLGSLSGLAAPWVYRAGDAPKFHTGHAILIAMCLGCFAMALTLRLYCQWENRERNQGKRDHLIVGLTPLEEVELSSKHPSFRYLL